MIATVDDGRLISLRPDKDHPLSSGFACQKGIAFTEVVNDPDRVTTPLRQTATGFEPVSWDEALTDIAAGLSAILRRDGSGAVGWYMGNPAAFSYSHLFGVMAFIKGVGRHSHYFTASSQDTSNRLAASQFLYGSPMVVPIPDPDAHRPAGHDGRESRCFARQLPYRTADQGPHARHRQARGTGGGRRIRARPRPPPSSNGWASSPTATPTSFSRSCT